MGRMLYNGPRVDDVRADVWGRSGLVGDDRNVLRELSVQNLALIEDVHVELEDGYCAWTGETGAGKSLLLTALGLILGGKASAELVRSGKSEARAAAVFDIDDPRPPRRGRGDPRRRRSAGRRRRHRHPTDLQPGPRRRDGQRPAGDGRYPPEVGRAAGRYPRPARGPRPDRPRPPARLARRFRRARGSRGSVSEGPSGASRNCDASDRS